MAEQDDGGDSPKKPMSFKDRIAMFNQPKAAPAPGPPPRATKPHAFKWKTSSEKEEGASSKTVNVKDVPPPAPTPTPGSGPSVEDNESGKASAGEPEPLTEARPVAPARLPSGSESSSAAAAGAPLKPISSAASGASAASSSDGKSAKAFSAEDAKQSAGSLKDRIALLSGLKVDQPGAPGRPPKPWRKKTTEPEEQKQGEAKEEGQDVVSPSSENAPPISSVVSDAPSSTPAPGELQEGGEAVPAKTDLEADSAASAEKPPSLKKDSLEVPPESDSKASPGNSGVALPSMPTRTRGPPRKGRSGGNAAATSPASSATSPSTELPPKPEQAPSQEAPSLSDVGSPSAPPNKDLNDGEAITRQPPVASAAVDEPESMEGDRKEEEEDNTTELAPPRRASTGPPSRAVPLPPPTAATAADDDDDDDDDEEDGDGDEEPNDVAGEKTLRVATAGAQKDRGDDGVSSIQAGLAQQSLEERDVPVAPSKSMPTVPPRLETQISSTSASVTSPKESASSPAPSLTNRRSMTRPPVPSGYSQSSATPSSPSRSSFDAGSPRGSVVGSQRGSLLMSPSQPDMVTGEPASLSSEVEGLPRSSMDSGRERDRDASARSSIEGTRSVDSPTSPLRQDSVQLPQQRRQSSTSPLPPTGGMPPVRSASVASRTSYTSRPEEESQEQETNISAMQAYRSPPVEQDAEGSGKPDAEEEEEYEDPEVARRQALAKRMAAMGGMKIGMLPPMFGGAKKKKTLPKEPEAEVEQAAAAPPASAPPPPPPQQAASSDMEDEMTTSPTRPVAPKSTPSHRPPVGAFVLPSFGKPPAPPVAPEEDREEDEDVIDQQTPHAESEPVFETQGDDTVTQELIEDEEEEEGEAAPPPPPPPIPAGRPNRPPPPPGQSFIEDDTDTEGGISDKRTSISSSAGVGSMPDFPAPPIGGGQPHVRTMSTASRYSNYDAPAPLTEASEYVEEPGAYRDEAEEADAAGPPPPRPARPPPPLDTTNLDRSGSYISGGSGSAPSRQTSMAEPSSPSQSMHRSVPGTPASAHGRQGSFDPLSPTASSGSGSGRRASMPPPGQPAAGSSPVQPGLNNQYLAYLASNAARTKSREIDGALAHTLNDIAYTYRSDPANFGMPVWRTFVSGKGTPPDLQIHGRIEAGCVFLAWDAKFDRGLGRSSLKVGSAEVPHVGIIAESVKDIKKAKVKVVELAQGRHNVETYKLDDIKSGTVEIRRLA